MFLNRARIHRQPVLYPSNKTLDDFRSILRVGQNIRGRVLYVLDKQKYLIRFRGFNVVTESDENLYRGQVVTARVVAISDKIIMRIVREVQDSPGRENIVQLVTTDDILRSMEVAPDPNNRAVLEMMIRYNLPIDPEQVRSMSAAIAQMGDPEMAEAAVLAHLLGVADSRETIIAIDRAIRDGFGRTLTALLDSLQGLPGETAAALEDLIRRLVDDSENPIRRFLRLSGIDYEDLIARSEIDSLHGSLKGVLLELLSRDDLPDDLISRIKSALDNIEGQKFLNLPRQALRYDLPVLFLNIPVSVGEDSRSFYIKGYPDPDGKINPNNLRLDMLFETSNLGNVRVLLTKLNDSLMIKVWVRDETVMKIINEASGRLISKMGDFCRIDSFHCEVDPDRTEVVEMLEFEPDKTVQRQTRIDLMA